MICKLITDTGTSYLDYGSMLDFYTISKPTLHRLLTGNLVGVPHRNKKIYLESEVLELFAAHGITSKK